MLPVCMDVEAEHDILKKLFKCTQFDVSYSFTRNNRSKPNWKGVPVTLP